MPPPSNIPPDAPIAGIPLTPKDTDAMANQNPARIGDAGPHAAGAQVSEPSSPTTSPELEKTSAQVQGAAPAAPNTPAPGAGGWVPPAWGPIALGVGGAGITAVADLINSACVSGVCQQIAWPMLVAAFIKGLVVGAVGYFGTKSAGPRNPQA